MFWLFIREIFTIVLLLLEPRTVHGMCTTDLVAGCGRSDEIRKFSSLTTVGPTENQSKVSRSRSIENEIDARVTRFSTQLSRPGAR